MSVGPISTLYGPDFQVWAVGTTQHAWLFPQQRSEAAREASSRGSGLMTRRARAENFPAAMVAHRRRKTSLSHDESRRKAGLPG